ncbi:hypothetical protein TNCV_1529621 [Trichonephila clavipes]|uniref:Uncharacterized protein n=1 Tax=Trichonephila clavipes TaxID=2585209 RepID=A0A8X6SHZ9_TRICX|nr:hypothetical protein TNCV_1529621 [Trichonephila clavipes]
MPAMVGYLNHWATAAPEPWVNHYHHDAEICHCPPILASIFSWPHRFDPYDKRFSYLPNLPISIQLYDLFQTPTVARNDLESCTNYFFLSLEGILTRNVTEILTFILKIASYRHLLSAQLQCAVASAIHSSGTKF